MDRIRQLLEQLKQRDAQGQERAAQYVGEMTPEKRQLYRDMAMGMTSASTAPTSQLLDEATQTLVQSLLRKLKLKRGMSVGDAYKLQQAYETNIPPIAGEGLKTGKLPSIQAMADRLSGLIPKQRFDIRQIIPK